MAPTGPGLLLGLPDPLPGAMAQLLGARDRGRRSRHVGRRVAVHLGAHFFAYCRLLLDVSWYCDELPLSSASLDPKKARDIYDLSCEGQNTFRTKAGQSVPIPIGRLSAAMVKK